MSIKQPRYRPISCIFRQTPTVNHNLDFASSTKCSSAFQLRFKYLGPRLMVKIQLDFRVARYNCILYLPPSGVVGTTITARLRDFAADIFLIHQLRKNTVACRVRRLAICVSCIVVSIVSDSKRKQMPKNRSNIIALYVDWKTAVTVETRPSRSTTTVALP